MYTEMENVISNLTKTNKQKPDFYGQTLFQSTNQQTGTNDDRTEMHLTQHVFVCSFVVDKLGGNVTRRW